MSRRAIAQPKAAHQNLSRKAEKLSALPTDDALALHGADRAVNLARITALDAQFREFVDHAGGYLHHSPMTLLWYRRSYGSYRAFLQAGVALPEAAFSARIFDIEGWVTYLWQRTWRGRKLSPITVNSYWRGLRRFYVHVEDRLGGLNPLRGMQAPTFNAPVPKAKSADDCRRILETSYHYPWPEPHAQYKRVLGRAVIGVMLFAGLRRSEVVQLRNGDIDLASGTIHVAYGKGVAGGRPRKAYISPELRTILLAYNRERDAVAHLKERPEYFVSPKSGTGLSLEGLRKIVAKISRASGVEFSSHALRHSFITHLLRSDVPLHIVRELAGHRSIATTLGYLRVFDEDLFTNIRKMRFK
jgi:site-specific recombinase XerD